MRRAPASRRTTAVPVTTMEALPVLSEEERDALVRELQQSQAQVDAGQAVDHDPATLKQRLLAIYRGAKR